MKVELKGNTGEGTGCTQLIALDPHQLMFGLVQISYTKSLELKIGNRGSVSFDILTIKISSDQEKPVPQYILKNIVEDTLPKLYAVLIKIWLKQKMRV